jgi:hypothetical protein
MTLTFVGVFVLFFTIGLVDLLNRLAAWLNVTPRIGAIDVPTAVTILLVDGLLGFIGWYFGGRHNRPDIKILNETEYYETPEASHYGIRVWNRGSEGAMSCQAKISLVVRPEDIVSMPKKTVLITKQAFKKTDEIPIQWCSQQSADFSIRPDNKEFLELFRVVQPQDKILGHFEIPSMTGWAPMLVALKPDDYEGKIKISPMNGKPASESFFIRYEKGTVYLNMAPLFLLSKIH